MGKPIILITGGPAFDPKFHLESRMLNKTYTVAVEKAGGLPFMNLDDSVIDDYVEFADGAIFTGTHHFTPSNELDLQPYQVERIKYEHRLMRAFIERGKPVMGICQGLQQLNAACGGDLHVNFKVEYGVEHYYTYHSVKAVEGSLVNRLFGDEFTVNSLHNVKIKNLAPCLKATAFSPDGVIEAFEHISLPVYGFQWHPERMRGDFPNFPYDPDGDLLFKYFVDLCK